MIQQLFLVLRVEIAVPETPRKLGENEIVTPGLANRLDNPLAYAEDRIVDHVGLVFVIRCRGKNDVGPGGVGGELAVYVHEKIESGKGTLPEG